MKTNNSLRRFPGIGELGAAMAELQGLTWKVFLVSIFFITVGTIGMLLTLNNRFLVEIPASGGHIKEGIIGNPSIINPLLSLTTADREITSLVYAGLLKKDSAGNLYPEIAESYEKDESETTYTFHIREDAKFHDGESVTAEDVRFTIALATNPVVKSPRRANWDGVTVEVVDEKTVRFIMESPFSGFLENATIGILPAHILKDVDPSALSQHNFNQNPIGAGPFQISRIKKSGSGLIGSISLSSFNDYVLGKPHLAGINLVFFDSEKSLAKAIESGRLDRGGPLSTEGAAELSLDGKTEIKILPLAKTFGLFFNQNRSQVLADQAVRESINIGIDRNEILDEVLQGFGGIATDPYQGNDNMVIARDIERAKEILEKASWKAGADGVRSKKIGKEEVRLAFTITTADQSDLRKTGEFIKKQMLPLGIEVRVESFELGILNQNIIAERNFEALLFGELIQRSENLYAFWHSAERNYPGLNITGYANRKMDDALLTLLSVTDETKREEALEAVAAEVRRDLPAVFLYRPANIYAVSENATKIYQEESGTERFTRANAWYEKTDKVWKFFTSESD